MVEVCARNHTDRWGTLKSISMFGSHRGLAADEDLQEANLQQNSPYEAPQERGERAL